MSDAAGGVLLFFMLLLFVTGMTSCHTVEWSYDGHHHVLTMGKPK